MAPYDEGGDFLPPATQPREVRGGIRLQSRRGASSWWARRWLAALEAGAAGERHAQALDDARRGRVLELEVELGVIRARVQGTRREPHVVTISLAPIEQRTWLRIVTALASRGESRAELLARQVPESVEAAFRREGAELFPAPEDDVDVSCTCDDWSTPCRHALAAGMLVAEAMDSDPMLAFRARGIEPELLLAIVAGPAAAVAGDAEDGAGAGAGDGGEPGAGGVEAANDVEPGPAAASEPIVVALDAPAIDAPLVRILGAPPMWRGADAFEPTMRRLYARVASDPRTLDAALGS